VRMMVFRPENRPHEEIVKERRAWAARSVKSEERRLKVSIVVASAVGVCVALFAPAQLVNVLFLSLCVVGVLASWIVVDRLDDRRCHMLVHDALAEIADNLVEVALAYDEDKRALRRYPNLCLDKVTELCERGSRYVPGYAGSVGYDIDIIDPFVAKTANSLLCRRVASSDDLDGAEDDVEDFVETSLRFVLEAGRQHPVECATALDLAGFEDLRWCLDHGARVAFYSSEAERPLGAHPPPILCWFKDGAPDGPMVFQQFDKFRDMATGQVAGPRDVQAPLGVVVGVVGVVGLLSLGVAGLHDEQIVLPVALLLLLVTGLLVSVARW